MASWLQRTALIFVTLATARAAAQSLADLAEKEKARRQQDSASATKAYTNDDLQSDGSAAPDSEVKTTEDRGAAGAAGGARPPRSSGSEAASGEAYWRGRAARANERIVAAERRVAGLEARASRLGRSSVGPLPGACTEGFRVDPSGNVDRSRTERVCDPDILRAQEGQRVQAELVRARDDLQRARDALVDLEEDARRKGALPGWLR